MAQYFGICGSAFLIVAAALSTTVAGQADDTIDTVGGPFTGPPVLNAPFSADATTTLTQILDDGTRHTQSATARYYRDSMGRVRVEQFVGGGVNPTSGPATFITIADSGDGAVYTLDPRRRIARSQSRGILGANFSGGSTFAIPLGASQFGFRTYFAPRSDPAAAESFGNRTIEGVATSGHRITTPVPNGRADHDGRREIVDEWWVSADLKLVIYAHLSDPITGVFEYRLTNISRREQPPDLFVMLEEYTRDLCPSQKDPCFKGEPFPQANRQDARGHGPIVQ